MTRYLDQLNETTDPTTGDFLHIYDASAGATDKDRKVNISKFAILANAQSFTAAQTFSPPSGSVGVNVSMPSGTSVSALQASYNSVLRWYVSETGTVSEATLSQCDLGANAGPHVGIFNNNNATTPAAGFLYMLTKGGSGYCMWVDNSGNVRVGTTTPTSAQDTSGTVVGTQTSTLSEKNIIGSVISQQEAIGNIQDASKALRRFTYKSGAYNGEVFDGLVVDYVPRYGMDRDATHPAGKSLNTITLLGDLIQAVGYLSQRLQEMEAANG